MYFASPKVKYREGRKKQQGKKMVLITIVKGVLLLLPLNLNH